MVRDVDAVPGATTDSNAAGDSGAAARGSAASLVVVKIETVSVEVLDGELP
jgi:hypothetical protein